MGVVVDLAEWKARRGPHCTGRVLCLCCFREWQAIWPMSADPLMLECPDCGVRNSIPVAALKFRRGEGLDNGPPPKVG